MRCSGRSQLRLGFLPLVDCAPLVVAHERGLFAAQGLDVALSREASWANVRDKVQAGLLDGAHMLGPMPLAASLGAGGERTAMIAPLSLNTNGAAVTVSTALAEEMRALDPAGMAKRPRTAGALAKVVASRRAAGGRPLVLATVFSYSMHAYLLRYWLAQAGIDPDRDVRLVVTPPPRMGARLEAGEIDGFCVGAPWNALSQAVGAGETLIDAAEFWPGGPDKVLGVTAAWATLNAGALQGLIRALITAAAWADEPGNRDELTSMLAAPAYVDTPAAVLRLALADPVQGVRFHRGAAGFPWRSHAAWFLCQMARWGQVDGEEDPEAIARQVYRPDLYRAAAADLGTPAPLIDSKVEGRHAAPWSLEEATKPIAMTPDRFFDGRLFDPAGAQPYVRSFSVGRARAVVAPGR